MIKCSFCILLIFLLFSCNTKNIQRKDVSNPGYLAPAVPFKINNYNECIEIEELTGRVLFYLFVSDEGRLEAFNIYQLNLSSHVGNTVALYSNYSDNPISVKDYPDNIIRYYWEFENYLSSLEFVKQEQVRVDKINKFYLISKIGCR